MFSSATYSDIIFSAVAAALITWLIIYAKKIFTAVIGHATEFAYNPKNLEAVMERCCFLFPNENMFFNGDTYTRGMSVRVITINRRTIEGKFIGSNKDNIFCVVTNNSVFAQELESIEEIKPMEG